tara:strand:+ start:1327 stop:1758 length:432 start_codon:yes stop_codon:yes gene_type:complete
MNFNYLNLLAYERPLTPPPAPSSPRGKSFDTLPDIITISESSLTNPEDYEINNKISGEAAKELVKKFKLDVNNRVNIIVTPETEKHLYRVDINKNLVRTILESATGYKKYKNQTKKHKKHKNKHKKQTKKGKKGKKGKKRKNI